MTYPEGNELTLAEDLSEILSRKRITLSVAESCTGGMLGSMITSVPGSSRYFLGGVVSYSNDMKEELLKVPKHVMIKKGAVSEDVACSMAAGVRELFGSDISASITGVAGPGGGTASKPVGLVWIGISTKDGTFAKKFCFDGDRENVRSCAVGTAAALLIEAADRYFC